MSHHELDNIFNDDSDLGFDFEVDFDAIPAAELDDLPAASSD
jgi:hypothetical protein